MPKRYKIDCVVLCDHYDPHAQISDVGGPLRSKERYQKSITEVIQEIESGKSEYYLSRNGVEEDLAVMVSRWGNKYIGSEQDRNTLDGLVMCRDQESNQTQKESHGLSAIENQVDTQEDGMR